MLRSNALRAALVLSIGAHTSLAALQQTPPSGQAAAPPDGLIMGRVVDADSGAAIPGVIVNIAQGTGAAMVRGSDRRVLADSQGRFVFRQLAKGTYTLAVTIGGSGFSPSGFLISGFGHQIGAYLNGGFGQRRPGGPMQAIELGENERLGDVTIRLWKGGSIDGHVADETGEPLVGVVVGAARRSTDGKLLTGPTVKTDDRGAYHLSTLTPGEYVVVVFQTQVLMPLSSVEAFLSADPQSALRTAMLGADQLPVTTGVPVGSVMVGTASSPSINAMLPASQADRFFVYQTTFYPASTSVARAKPLTVRSGEELAGIDVQLTPVPAVEVSGVLTDGASGVPNFRVRLMPTDEGDGAGVLEVASITTDPQGRFTFPLVPSGQHRVVAQRERAVAAAASDPAAARPLAEAVGAWATQPVSVGDRNIAGLTLTLRPGARVIGRVVFSGTAPRPPADQVKSFMISIIPAQPQTRSADMGPLIRAGIGAAGEFSIAAFPPGRYVFQVPDRFPGWGLQSVVVGGRDVTDAAFAIGAEDLSDVVITLSDQPAELSGTVSGAKGSPDGDASVFVFPVDRTRWPDGRASARAFRTVRASKTGAFAFPNLVAGEYLAVAAPDALAGDWPDEKFLQKLSAAATLVRITAGLKAVVALKTVDIR